MLVLITEVGEGFFKRSRANFLDSTDCGEISVREHVSNMAMRD